MKRPAIWLTLPVIAALLGFAHGRAAAASEPQVCLVRAFAIAPIDTVANDTAATWAVLLRSDPRSGPGVTTGVIALVGENERYDVPVVNFQTPDVDGVNDEIPLVVRFPKPVKLVLGYVKAVGTAGGEPCLHVSVFADNPFAGGSLETLRDRVGSAVPVLAPAPALDPPLKNCVDDGVRTNAKPDLAPPPIYNFITIKALAATVRVDLTDEGVPLLVSINETSGNPHADDAALDRALASTYLPGRFHCRPYGGTYLYIAEFIPPQ